MLTAEHFNQRGTGHLPGHLGIVITHVSAREVRSELAVRKALMAPNGYLHAGSVVTLADTSAGYGCVVNLPEGATGFTTVELKSNHVGTALDGTIECVATA
ncbi:MAG TPA: PaaI family thioesterase, partial [Burkholderiaceae bacterium]|nr:PaaI family thioesterase [Burkholderiaceae bacterium]